MAQHAYCVIDGFVYAVQALYFERYVKILAPTLSVLDDDRLILRDAMNY